MDKVSNKVCFKRYYKTKNLKKPVKFTKYYTSSLGYVYNFNDKIKITLKYTGAILYILSNYEVEYDDKVNLNTHILKVINHNELFAIITNLNKLDAIVNAKPVLNRIYRKGYLKPRSNTAKSRTISASRVDEDGEKSKSKNVLKGGDK
jgi:hypothetical protein